MDRRELKAAGYVCAAFLASILAVASWNTYTDAAITTSPVGGAPQVVGIDATGGQIELDFASGYTLWHTGKTTSGVVTEEIIVIGIADQATTADYSPEADKLILAPNSSVRLLKGQRSVYAKSASGTIAVQFMPLQGN